MQEGQCNSAVVVHTYMHQFKGNIHSTGAFLVVLPCSAKGLSDVAAPLAKGATKVWAAKGLVTKVKA
jgi:hypothetical protein